MELSDCHPLDLSPEDYAACMSLNFRKYGDLRYWLPEAKGIKNARVVLAKDNGQVIGWGLIKPYHEKHFKYGQCEIGFYVRQNYRRQGIGTMLLRLAESLAKIDVRGYNKHDDRAKAFFEKVGY